MTWAKQKTGFTIVELLVVIVVIAILAAVVTLSYNGIVRQAHGATVDSRLSTLQKKIETLKISGTTGVYPEALPSNVQSTNTPYVGYVSINGGADYCVMAKSGDVTRFVMSAKAGIQEGLCLSNCSNTIYVICGASQTASSVARDSESNYYVLHYGAYTYKYNDAGVLEGQSYAGFSKYDKNFNPLWTRLSSGSADGSLNATYFPWGIYSDPEGNIWVADTGNHRYQKYDKDGNFLLKIGGPTAGAGTNQFNTAYGMAFTNDGHAWIADRYNNRILKYKLSGELVQTVDNSTGANLSQPHGVYIDAGQNIYVASRTSHRIQKYNSSGTLIATIGAGVSGVEDGRISEPTTVLVDPANGDIYTYEIANRRISVFSASGAFIRKFSTISLAPEMNSHRSFSMIWNGDEIMLAVQNAGTTRLQVLSKSGDLIKVYRGTELLLQV